MTRAACIGNTFIENVDPNDIAFRKVDGVVDNLVVRNSRENNCHWGWYKRTNKSLTDNYQYSSLIALSKIQTFNEKDLREYTKTYRAKNGTNELLVPYKDQSDIRVITPVYKGFPNFITYRPGGEMVDENSTAIVWERVDILVANSCIKSIDETSFVLITSRHIFYAGFCITNDMGHYPALKRFVTTKTNHVPYRGFIEFEGGQLCLTAHYCVPNERMRSLHSANIKDYDKLDAATAIIAVENLYDSLFNL